MTDSEKLELIKPAVQAAAEHDAQEDAAAREDADLWTCPSCGAMLSLIHHEECPYCANRTAKTLGLDFSNAKVASL